MLPTLKYLKEQGASSSLCRIWADPKGRPEPTLRLDPIAVRLGELPGVRVEKVDDCVGESAEAAANSLVDGEFLLLENLRFHPEEEANDPDFAKALARLGDVYVNDAFGAAHRAHVSTEGVAK